MLRNRQQNMSSIEYGRVTIAHCQRELAECKHYADVCASSAGSFRTQMVGTKWDKRDNKMLKIRRRLVHGIRREHSARGPLTARLLSAQRLAIRFPPKSGELDVPHSERKRTAFVEAGYSAWRA